MRSRMVLSLPSAPGGSDRPKAAPSVERSQRSVDSVPSCPVMVVARSIRKPHRPWSPTLTGAGISSMSMTSVLNRSAQPRDQASLYEYEEDQNGDGHHRRGCHDPSPVVLVRFEEDQQRHRKRRLGGVADEEGLGEQEVVPGRDERED